MFSTLFTDKKLEWHVLVAKFTIYQIFEEISYYFSLFVVSTISDDGKKLIELNHAWAILINQINHILYFIHILREPQSN